MATCMRATNVSSGTTPRMPVQPMSVTDSPETTAAALTQTVGQGCTAACCSQCPSLSQTLLRPLLIESACHGQRGMY
eukprot:2240249-Rhodomonas_salina.1